MRTAAAILLVIALNLECQARLVPNETDASLTRQADFVADVVFSHDIPSDAELIGYGDSTRFLARHAILLVRGVIKGDSHPFYVEMLYFTGGAGFDQEAFVTFDRDPRSVYRVYLRRAESGVYEPVTGHFDAAYSVRKRSRLPENLKRDSEAQPGATDNPGDAQRLREDH